MRIHRASQVSLASTGAATGSGTFEGRSVSELVKCSVFCGLSHQVALHCGVLGDPGPLTQRNGASGCPCRAGLICEGAQAPGPQSHEG